MDWEDGEIITKEERLKIERKAIASLRKSRKIQGLDKRFDGEKYIDLNQSYFDDEAIFSFHESCDERGYFDDREATRHLSDIELVARNNMERSRIINLSDPFVEKIRTLSSQPQKIGVPDVESRESVYAFCDYWKDQFRLRKVTEQDYDYIVETPIEKLMREAAEVGKSLQVKARGHEGRLLVNWLSVQLQNPRTLKEIKTDLMRQEYESKPIEEQLRIKKKRVSQIIADCRKQTGLVDITSPKRYPAYEIRKFLFSLREKLSEDIFSGRLGLYCLVEQFFDKELRVVAEKHVTFNFDDWQLREYNKKFRPYGYRESSEHRRRVLDEMNRMEKGYLVYAKLGLLFRGAWDISPDGSRVKFYSWLSDYASILRDKIDSRRMTEKEYLFLEGAKGRDLIVDAFDRQDEILAEMAREYLDESDDRGAGVHITPLTLKLQNLKVSQLDVESCRPF